MENVEKAKQILHAAELYFKETVGVTKSLDHYAKFMAFLSVYFLTAVIALAIKFLGWPFLVCAVIFFVSACCFLYALKPKNGFKLPGNLPGVLRKKPDEIPLNEFIIWQSESYEKMIEINCNLNAKKAYFIKIGFNLINISSIASLINGIYYAFIII